MGDVLAYVAAGAVALWGVAHVVPTSTVVRGFGDIDSDNRRIITQEWIAEGLTMWFVAALVIGATVFGSDRSETHWVYGASACMLVAVGVLTTVTGARTQVAWFKICVLVMGMSAALLVAASVV